MISLVSISPTSDSTMLLVTELVNSNFQHSVIDPSSLEQFERLFIRHGCLDKYKHLFTLPENTKVYWEWDGNSCTFIPHGLTYILGSVETEAFTKPSKELSLVNLDTPETLINAKVVEAGNNYLTLQKIDGTVLSVYITIK